MCGDVKIACYNEPGHRGAIIPDAREHVRKAKSDEEGAAILALSLDDAAVFKTSLSFSQAQNIWGYKQ